MFCGVELCRSSLCGSIFLSLAGVCDFDRWRGIMCITVDDVDD